MLLKSAFLTGGSAFARSGGVRIAPGDAERGVALNGRGYSGPCIRASRPGAVQMTAALPLVQSPRLPASHVAGRFVSDLMISLRALG